MTKIAFLMDPIETVAIKKDSTLAMIRAAQLRGLEGDESAQRSAEPGVARPPPTTREGRTRCTGTWCLRSPGPS